MILKSCAAASLTGLETLMGGKMTDSTTRCDADAIDLRGAHFETDKSPSIEALRKEGFYARVDGGDVFFNAEEARWIFKCSDFRFDFFQIDRNKSPYLADSIENELLNMHGEPHERLKKIVMRALRDQIVDGLKDGIRDIAKSLIDAMPA